MFRFSFAVVLFLRVLKTLGIHIKAWAENYLSRGEHGSDRVAYGLDLSFDPDKSGPLKFHPIPTVNNGQDHPIWYFRVSGRSRPDCFRLGLNQTNLGYEDTQRLKLGFMNQLTSCEGLCLFYLYAFFYSNE